MNPDVRQRVLDVYAAADAAVAAASPKCDASGRCCHFKEYGHTLFISQFEADILLETAPAYAKPVTADGCPFQVNDLCTARADRPLGCRVYFCDPTYEETGNRITEESLAKLKRIADEHDAGWMYAPLHVFLNAAERPAAPAADTMSPDDSPPERKPAMPRFRLLSALGLTLTLTLSLPAKDWPQFLGPTRDNSSPEKVAAWKGGLNAAWKQPVGAAHSSPVVAGGVVYAFYQPKGKNADALAAFDAESGKPLWEKSYDRPEFKPPFGSGPRSTPAVDGGKVFTLGGTGILACWDAKTGDIAWKVDTLKEFNAPNLFFGISTSPLVEGDTVVVMVGGKNAGVVAVDKATGKTRWQTSSDPASYASPVAVGTGVDRQIMTLTGSHLRAVSPAGKELWGVPFKDRLNESSTSPVKAGEYVVGGSVTAGSIGVKVARDGETWTTTTAWKNPALTCYFSTPVVVGKHLYMVNGAASLTNPSITLRCVELETGKVAWEKAKIARYHAAIIKTGDDKLLMLDDNGFLTLFAPDPSGYKELAKSKVCGPTWAHPAVAGGRLYLRDEAELVCVPLGE